jgi:hypothetical protein
MICEGEFDRLVLEANRFKAGCERLYSWIEETSTFLPV